MLPQRALDSFGVLDDGAHQPNGSVVFPIRSTHLIQVRQFDVELYTFAPVRSRSTKKPEPGLRVVDTGVWRIGGYVRWQAERHATDFFLLDEVDELLRDHFPREAGTVHRADLPTFIPSVRLSAVR